MRLSAIPAPIGLNSDYTVVWLSLCGHTCVHVFRGLMEWSLGIQICRNFRTNCDLEGAETSPRKPMTKVSFNGTFVSRTLRNMIGLLG